MAALTTTASRCRGGNS